jgi:hypothetical protein
VKVLGIIGLVAALLFAGSHVTGLGGLHGPGQHLAGLTGHSVPANATATIANMP